MAKLPFGLKVIFTIDVIIGILFLFLSCAGAFSLIFEKKHQHMKGTKKVFQL